MSGMRTALPGRRGPALIGQALTGSGCFLLLAAMASVPVFAQTQAKPPSFAGPYKIAGTVTNAATGDPLQHAIVSALGEDSRRTVATVVADAQGHFEIAGLAAAKYPLTASKRGYHTAFYDDHDGFNTAIVTGPDRDTTHLAFRLTSTAILRGVVTADGGDPVENARVMLFEKPRPNWTNQRTIQIETAVTDDTGAYEFADLRGGEYLVAVAAQPWYAMHSGIQVSNGGVRVVGQTNPQLDVAYPVTYFDSTTEEASATTITLTSGSREEANLNLHAVPALRIGVEVPVRADGKLARPEMQQIVFGSPVSAESVGFLDAMATAKTEFNGVAPGLYELTLGDPPRIVDLNATESGEVDPNSGIGTVAVSGVLRIVGETKAPPEAHLFLQQQEGSPSHANRVAAARDGRFNLEALAPGTWAVSVEIGGKMLSVVGIATEEGTHAGNLITVRDRPLTLTVLMNASGTSRMDGFAQKDGKGFAGALVLLVPRNPAQLQTLSRRDQSDSDGSFSLRDVVPGSYTVVAIEDGWDSDWLRQGAIARFLPRGTAVTVRNTPGGRFVLAGPVTVQPR